MDLENLTLEEKSKFKKYIVIALLVVALILGLVGYFIGSAVLNGAYDSKQELSVMLSENSKIVDVENGQDVFHADSIPVIEYSEAEILDLSKEERYNLNMIEVAERRIWDDLGEKLSLEGCKYEFGYGSNTLLYKVYSTSMGDILIKCSSITGSISSVYSDDGFSDEEKKILDSVNEYILYSEYEDGSVDAKFDLARGLITDKEVGSNEQN